MTRAAGAALLLLLGACAREGTGGSASVVSRDSAGVRIVENRGGVPALGWRVDDTPVVSIGGEQPGVGALFQVTDAIRLEDGSIVVASAGTHQLRIYAADGRLLRTVGRAGEGPGEFRAPLWLGRLRGDSIATWDGALRRFSIFTPQGDFVRAVTPGGDVGFLPQCVGVLPDGRFILAVSATAHPIPPPGQTRRDTSVFVLIDSSGAQVDTLGRFPGTEMVALGTPSTGLLVRPLPFGLQTVTAVHAGSLYVSTSERYEVSVYAGGGLDAVYRGVRERIPVTRNDVREYRRTLVTLGGDAQARSRSEELLASAPVPATMPALAGLRVDTAGNLWVLDTRKPAQTGPGLWTVFSPDGRIRGRVGLPPDLIVKSIGEDWVLGVELDQDEVEWVRLYRLRRTE